MLSPSSLRCSTVKKTKEEGDAALAFFVALRYNATKKIKEEGDATVAFFVAL